MPGFDIALEQVKMFGGWSDWLHGACQILVRTLNPIEVAAHPDFFAINPPR